MSTITTVEQLRAHYKRPLERALWKEIDHINDHYQAFVKVSPFVVLATTGEHGLDCSPRGESAGFVRVVSEKKIMIPDRPGNNRLDTLQNIIENPQIGLIFLVPGVGETLRIRGRATINVDQALCDSFSVNGKPARSIIDVDISAAYFQCQKAIARSKLWNAETVVSERPVPTAGQMAEAFSKLHNEEFDGKTYDENYPEYMKKILF